MLEILRFTEEIRMHVIKESTSSMIKMEAMKDGMKTLRMDALSKAIAGITTLEEVLRVTASDDERILEEIRSKK